MEGGGDEFMSLGELKIRDEVVTITGFSSQIINITNNHQQQGQRSQPQLFLSAATRYQQQVFSTRCDLLPTSIKHRSNVHLLSHSYCSWCLWRTVQDDYSFSRGYKWLCCVSWRTDNNKQSMLAEQGRGCEQEQQQGVKLGRAQNQNHREQPRTVTGAAIKTWKGRLRYEQMHIITQQLQPEDGVYTRREFVHRK